MRQQVITQKAIRDRLEQELTAHQQRSNAAWLQKGPKQNGLNRSKIVQDVREAYHLTLCDADVVQPADAQAVETVARAVVKDVKTAVQRDLEARHSKLLTDWERVSGNLDEFVEALAKEISCHRNLKVARQTVQRLQSKLGNMDGEGIPAEKHEDLFRSKGWPAEHVVEDGKAVQFPDLFWWNAPKTALGENTTLPEKIRAFRHWVSLVQRVSERNNPNIRLWVTALRKMPSADKSTFAPTPQLDAACGVVGSDDGSRVSRRVYRTPVRSGAWLTRMCC